MTIHRTSCEKCNLAWENSDERDYSKDTCPNCKGVLRHDVAKRATDTRASLYYSVVPRDSFD